MTKLMDQLEKHYPLLTPLRIAEMPRSAWESLPGFLGLLLAAAESPDRRSCCFVFPDASRVASTAAALLALSKLAREFDDLAREYAQRKFEPGQRVTVRPSGHVYEYTGVWDLRDGHPDRFRLQVLGSGDARSLLVSEILRLEPTSRKRPKGQVGTPLGCPEQGILDRLLEIAGYGNRALFRNRIMYLTSRTKFEAFVENTALYRPQAGATNDVGGELHDILPWGSIREDGTLALEDHYQAEGEPLLAVTHSVENVAEACALAEPFSRVVFADGPDKLVRNLQAYDQIADSQKLIVVADHGSEDALSMLEERECCIWRVSAEEIDPGRDASSGAKSVFFGRTFNAARNYRELEIDAIDCSSNHLETAAENLIRVGKHLDSYESDEETKRCLCGLFGLLFRLSGHCTPPETQEQSEFLGRLNSLEHAVERRAIWVPEEVMAHLRDAGAALRRFVSTSGTEYLGTGQTKREALLEMLRANGVQGGRRAAVVTRSQANADTTRRWLRTRGINVPVLCDGTFPETEFFDILVVLSWLNARRFGKLVRRYAAPRVCLLGYPFERRWLQQFSSRFLRDRASGRLSRAVRSELLGLPEQLLASTHDHAPVQPPAETQTRVSDPLSIFDIEHKIMRRRKGSPPAARSSQDTCPASYVGFVGETYAYLTENHAVPVITDLIKADASSPSPIPEHTADRLQIGDFLLFREGSDRDVVRLFAEEMMGRDLYEEQRALAACWRRALLSLGGSAREVNRRLSGYGLRRVESTVRSWMGNKNIIGPNKRSDIEAIAAAAGKERFAGSPEKVWEAIENIRAVHRSAGHRISEWLLAELAEKRDLVAGGEARVDLDFGRFWIVEVEDLDSDLDQYPVGQVNRLLWEQGH